AAPGRGRPDHRPRGQRAAGSAGPSRRARRARAGGAVGDAAPRLRCRPAGPRPAGHRWPDPGPADARKRLRRATDRGPLARRWRSGSRDGRRRLRCLPAQAGDRRDARRRAGRDGPALTAGLRGGAFSYAIRRACPMSPMAPGRRDSGPSSLRTSAMPVRLAVLLSLLLALCAVPGRAQPPSLMLARDYQAGVAVGDYWVSEKFDGVRGRWDGRALWTRGGGRIAAPDWFVAN